MQHDDEPWLGHAELAYLQRRLESGHLRDESGLRLRKLPWAGSSPEQSVAYERVTLEEEVAGLLDEVQAWRQLVPALVQTLEMALLDQGGAQRRQQALSAAHGRLQTLLRAHLPYEWDRIWWGGNDARDVEDR